MGKPLVDRIPFAKILVALAIAFGVALGLCGLNWALDASGFDKSNQPFPGTVFVVTGLLEIGVMLLSAVGLVLTAVFWAVLRGLSGRDSVTQPLVDDADKLEKSGEE